MFRSSHFFLFVFGHFWWQRNDNTKIFHNLCLHFARQDGQDGKKPGMKTIQLKWPKYQKPKIWDEWNISLVIFKHFNQFEYHDSLLLLFLLNCGLRLLHLPIISNGCQSSTSHKLPFISGWVQVHCIKDY